jgi:serpin B
LLACVLKLSIILGIRLRINNVCINEAYHQAFIDVNEEGTEASATTAGTASIGMKYKPFRSDHPFIYLIRDEITGPILFIGAVNDPSN